MGDRNENKIQSELENERKMDVAIRMGNTIRIGNEIGDRKGN